MTSKHKPSTPAGFVELTIAVVLSSCFGIAAVMKLKSMNGLYQVLETSRLFPAQLLWPIAQLVVGVEILTSLALLTPAFRKTGLGIGVILNALFLAFSIRRMELDVQTPCHCFGDLLHLSPLDSCILNALLVTVGLIALWLRKDLRQQSGKSASDRSLIIGVGVVAAALLTSIYAAHSPPNPASSGPSKIDATASEVIGVGPVYRPSIGRFTIVMFGDYQCGPCKISTQLLNSFQNGHPGLTRLTFRNLPLEAIHPYAYIAAQVAEAARKKGRFWDVHDALYATTNLDLGTIRTVALRYRLGTPWSSSPGDDPSHFIAEDLAFARKHSISSTPTFILIDEEQRCWQFESVSELFHFIDK